jgi:two-component system sensor histidine kinase/response regulator
MSHITLIIEDDDFLRSLTITKLQSAGFSVDGAADGKTGLEKLYKNKPDLLILDLMLPVMSGFDVLQNLRNNPDLKDLPVIVFSNLGEEADIKKCLDMGITDYMIKSNFTLDELVEKINTILK